MNLHIRMIVGLGVILTGGCSNGITYMQNHNIGYYFCDRNRSLTSAEQNDAFKWSPDGNKLAFTQEVITGGVRPGNSLVVRDMRTRVDTVLVHHSYGKVHHTFDWSPDNSAIVFEHDVCVTCNANISVISLGSTAPRLMTPLSTNDMQPDWSPASRRIAFVSRSSSTGSDIYWMNSDATGRSRLTNTPDNDIHPVWSPDAEFIAFIRGQTTTPPRYSIAKIRRSELAGMVTTLVEDFSSISYLSWSPDGSKLLFHARNTGGASSGIYTVNADGSGLTNLSSLPDPVYRNVDDLFPSWSPDGSQIAFTRDADFTRDGVNWHIQGALFRMNADGTNKERLTEEQFMHTTEWRSKDSICF